MLPKIETPRHKIKLPVSGLEVDFRPFLVKEQKVLLQAIEMGDDAQLNNAMDDIARACTFEKVDIDALPMADIEYLILNLRAKSVSESIELKHTCPKCKKITPFTLSLASIEVANTKKTEEGTIKFSMDGVGVIMKPVSYGMIKEAALEPSDLDRGYKLIFSSIDKVFDAEQVYTKNDFSDDELFEFLESLPTEDFKKIENYVAEQPKLKKDITIKCSSCGHEHTSTLEGLSDFLG